MMAIPDTATAQNKNVVMPPRTAEGMATRAAANFAKTPMMIKNMLTHTYVSIRLLGSELPSLGGGANKTYQQQYPAVRLAQRVRAMTPLFWAKVDMGVMVIRAARMPFKPSANTPPWIRDSYIAPSTSRPNCTY